MSADKPDCCTKDAHGYLAAPADYQPKGSMKDASGLPYYAVGEGSSTLIVANDIYGIDSGRHKQVADKLAADLGIQVVLPKLWTNGAASGNPSGVSWLLDKYALDPVPWYRKPGAFFYSLYHMKSFLGDLKAHNWDLLKPKLHDQLLPALKEGGTKKIGLLGFCWGGWFVTRASSSPEFCCAAACHPGVSDLCGMLGEDPKTIAEEVQCPQFMLTAGDDKEDVKPGGLLDEVYKTKSFGDKCVFKTFEAMKHGWVVRGTAECSEAYEAALSELKGFFGQHLSKL